MNYLVRGANGRGDAWTESGVANETEINRDTSEINITNTGNGDVAGVYASNGIAFTEGSENHQPEGEDIITGQNAPLMKSSIIVKNTGSGKAYGAYTNTDNGERFFVSRMGGMSIDVKNHGGTDTYGIKSSRVLIDSELHLQKNVQNKFNELCEQWQTRDKEKFNKYCKINNTISVNGGSGDTFGIWAKNGTYLLGNGYGGTGKLAMQAFGGGNVYGVYIDNLIGGDYWMYTINDKGNEISADFTVSGSKGEKTIAGIYVNNSDRQTLLTYNGGMTVYKNESDGKGSVLYGIYTKNAKVKASGQIVVNYHKGSDGQNDAKDVGLNTAYGIYADNSIVDNGATIDVYGANGKSYGIYAVNKSSVYNHGTINLYDETGKERGSYSENEKMDPYIYLDSTSSLSNQGVVKTVSALDLNSFGTGKVLLGKGGRFEAESISGNLGVDETVVSDGFENRYIEENALKADDIDVNLYSNSAMFKASRQTGSEEGAEDVIMQRRGFDEISQSSSVASYLEQNYAAHQNEELFRTLKKADNSTYAKKEAELLGTDLIPNFSQEDMRVMRNLNSVLMDSLFENNERQRKIVGYDYQQSERDGKGTLTGYENTANSSYFMYDTELENMLHTGLGMSITKFNSDYDNDSERKSMMIQLLAPVSYNFGNGWQYAGIGRLGYSDGEYERHANGNIYKADLNAWTYGMSNALRHRKNLGFAILETDAELNLLGYIQNRIRENRDKSFAIWAKETHNYSIETGLGLSLSKNIEIDENKHLRFKVGGIWFHEYGKPYHSLDAHLENTVGSYRLTDRNGIYNRDRGVLRAEIHYDWQRLTFYVIYKHYLEDEKPYSINAGVQYKF